MVIMNLKMNNILSFHNFHVNFSYPIKLRNTLIENENLKNIPSFRYKKLNIFVGANASGKTSLIRCIWKILLFLSKKEKQFITDVINYKYNESEIEIDLADDNDKPYLHRIKIKTENDSENPIILISHTKVSLSNSSSYECKIKELDRLKDDYRNYLDVLESFDVDYGWNVVFPATEPGFDEIVFKDNLTDEEEKEYLHVINSILKTLDPSIIRVLKSKDADNAYVIEHENTKKIIVQDGNKLASIPYLSSGTKYGFNIANIVFSIKKHRNGIYLIDEQFSYVNSDVELALISTIVSLLGANEQLFISTHNSNVLNLKYPFHSFYFMRKEKEGIEYNIKVDCASEVENRNNVSPKTILDNDVFATAPNVDMIFKLGE